MEKRTIKRKHIPLIIFILFTQFILAIFIAAIISNNSLSKKVQAEEKLRNAYNYQILDAASTKPTEITVDYSKQISTGSPLIFGGAHSPKLEHQDAWDKIADAGATSLRTDFFIQHSFQSGISLEYYKNNKNEVSNQNIWNANYINKRKEVYQKAKERGLKTIGIVSYAPKWLTHSGTEYGVPKDWEAYEDIVKKTYSFYRDYLDYLEIWNEPTYTRFLDLQNTQLSREEAYAQIFYHASKAVREVDNEKNDGKIIPIGGPVGHNPTETSLLEEIVKNPQTRQYINFISYHNYVQDEPSWDNYKKILKKYNMQNAPIFLTEWNYDSDEKKYDPNKNSDLAIIYTGNKLLNFLRMGLAGANYYSFNPIAYDALSQGNGYLGFYTWETDHAQLLPQAKTWRILSKDMKLGKGESKIYQPNSEDKSINSLGLVNVDKEPGIVIVNNTDKPYVANIKFDKIPLKNYADVEVFYASKDSDAQSPEYKSVLKVKNGATEFAYYVPAQTIMAVKLSERKEWFNFINH